MAHFRLACNEAAQTFLQLAVGLGLSRVLTQMFGPRMYQEYLYEAICCFSITEDAPPIRAIAAPDARILMDRLDELSFALWNHSIFDHHQNWTLLKVSSQLFDNDRHAPVVPWTQIGG